MDQSHVLGRSLLAEGLRLEGVEATSADGDFVEGRIGGQRSSLSPTTGRALALMRFESSPAGARVLVDGEVLCEATPCSRELALGSYQISMQQGAYPAQTRSLEVKGGDTLHINLQGPIATLKLETHPPGLEVSLNGQTAGVSPLSQPLAPGSYELEVASDCLQPTRQTLVLEDGEQRRVEMRPSPRVAQVQLDLVDSEGESLSAEVFADGVALGSVPGSLLVPICTQGSSPRPPAVGPGGDQWTSWRARETMQVRATGGPFRWSASALEAS